MFQPFVLFKSQYIGRLIQQKKNLLISQTYKRGNDPSMHPGKSPILLTDYDDLGAARAHLNAVKNDPLAAVIDLANQQHADKIRSLLLPDSKYLVYWSVFSSLDEVEKRMNLKYKENMKRYINAHTDWRIGSNETISPVLEVTYGNLFINLRWRTRTHRVEFEKIEKS